MKIRFGINKVKLQRDAGYIPLAVECDYKSTGICQYPLLHDLDGRKESATFVLIGDDLGANNLYTTSYQQFNTKSQAARAGVKITAYTNKHSVRFRNPHHQVNIYWNTFILSFRRLIINSEQEEMSILYNYII